MAWYISSASPSHCRSMPTTTISSLANYQHNSTAIMPTSASEFKSTGTTTSAYNTIAPGAYINVLWYCLMPSLKYAGSEFINNTFATSHARRRLGLIAYPINFLSRKTSCREKKQFHSCLRTFYFLRVNGPTIRPTRPIAYCRLGPYRFLSSSRSSSSSPNVA